MHLHAPPQTQIAYIVMPLRQGANDAATKSFLTHRGSLDRSRPGLRPEGNSIQVRVAPWHSNALERLTGRWHRLPELVHYHGCGYGLQLNVWSKIVTTYFGDC